MFVFLSQNLLTGYRLIQSRVTLCTIIITQQQQKMKILNSLKQTATTLQKKLSTPPPITQITPQIYHIPYPSPNTFPKLLQSLSPQPQQILLYNLSEYPYDKQLIRFLEEKGIEIVEITYQYYTSIPISISLQEVNKICAFVSKGDKNYVFVHCQENMARSVGFLAGFLCFGGIVQDVVVGLALVNQKLGINSNQTIYSSQHASLRNIANYHKDPTLINPHCLKLSKIILNQAPKHPQITLQPDQTLQIQLQIRKNAVVVYKKLSKQFGQGQIAHFNFFDKDKQKNNGQDNKNQNQNIVLSDDCLFSFKYVYNGKIYPVLRVQVNTNFVFGAFSRVPMQECDIVKGAVVKGQLFVDFLFTVVNDQQSELSKLAGHQGVSAPNTKKSKQKKQEAKSPQPKKAQQKKQTSKSVSSTSPDPITPNKTVQQKNIFKIQQEQKDKDEFDEKFEEEKLNRLIEQLATKKAKTEEQDMKFAEEEKEEERKKQKQLAQQIKIQQLNQFSQSQEIAKNQPISQLENKVKENKVIGDDQNTKAEVRQVKKEEPVTIKQSIVKDQIKKHNDTVEGQGEEEIDFGDYFSNLEKQAQTN